MKPTLLHSLWAAAAIGSFTLGATLFSDKTPEENTGRTADTLPTKSIRPPGAARRPGMQEASALQFLRDAPLLPEEALSESTIRTLGTLFKDSRDPIERAIAFGKLLETLTPENALLIRAQIEHLNQNTPEYKEFHYAWGAIAGADAVVFAEGTKKQDMGAALAGWASVNPEAAKEWLAAYEDPGDDEGRTKRLLGGLVHGLGDNDPYAATDFVLNHPGEEGQQKWMMGIVSNKMLRSEGPEGAGRWAETLPEGEMRRDTLWKIADHYANEDPASAVQWLQDMPDTNDRGYGLGSAMAKWAAEDIEAAEAHLNANSDSPQQDYAVGGFTLSLANQNPEEAMTIASSIATDEVRRFALVANGKNWMRQDQDAARAWVERTELPEDIRNEILKAK